MMSGPDFSGPGIFLPFLDFLLKVRHAVFRLIIFMQEQSYKNEGGITAFFEKYTHENHTQHSDMLHPDQL